MNENSTARAFSLKKVCLSLFLIIFTLSFVVPFQHEDNKLNGWMDKETFVKELHPSFPLEKREEAFLRYQEAQTHWLYYIIPRHLHTIRWYHFGPWIMWAVFGNEDDGIFGEGPHALWQTEERVSIYKAIRWAIRNPLHNFTFYIMGSAWQKNDELVLLEMDDDSMSCFLYREQASTVFYGRNDSLFIALHGWKPFVSVKFSLPYFNCHCQALCGWRERGNFGLKVQFRQKDEMK